jgi:triosephosphate isomerase
MRRKIAAGNWKMNLRLMQGVDLAQIIVEGLEPADLAKAEVIMAPPAIHLSGVAEVAATLHGVSVAAQNLHQEDSGAYTGEISAEMIQSAGCQYVLVGHSERRQYNGETNDLLYLKVQKAIEFDLSPIYCLGETLKDREANRTFAVVEAQLKDGVFGLDAENFGKVILAYEPVWAIGTGVTASPEQAQEVHAFLRGLVAQRYGEEVALETSILYGGSVKPGNAKELFSCPDIDGGLVGGASLNAEDFLAIVRSFPA